MMVNNPYVSLVFFLAEVNSCEDIPCLTILVDRQALG